MVATVCPLVPIKMFSFRGHVMQLLSCGISGVAGPLRHLPDMNQISTLYSARIFYFLTRRVLTI
jgi:hypothetical protein